MRQLKILGKMSSWQNVKLTKCQADKMSSWQNVKLTKCQADKIWSRQNVKLTKCQVDKMSSWQNVKLAKDHVDEMSSWQNVKLTKCRADKMSRWQKVMLTKYQVGKRSFRRNDLAPAEISWVYNVSTFMSTSKTLKNAHKTVVRYLIKVGGLLNPLPPPPPVWPEHNGIPDFASCHLLSLNWPTNFFR